MSLKNLFGKTSENIISNKELQKIYDDSESQQYVEQVIEEKNKFIPVVDFTSASNFARYGSAERYYVDALTNIYQNYPYDGSKKEKLEWRNRSTPFDLYVFDNLYPKTTGYVNLSANITLSSQIVDLVSYRSSSAPQYITVKGGPNPAIDGKFENSNIYDLKTNRECNLGITQQGNTVEFWFKDEYSSTGSLTNSRYALFDLWNGKAKSDNSYSRLLIENLNGTSFGVTYMSGSSGADRVSIEHSIDKNKWHHYAFTFKNNSQNNNNLDISLYVDGDLVKKITTTATGKINLANNSGMIANIGAYRTNIDANNNAWNGFGVSYGSYDELRFWKVARNSKQIFNSWHRSSGGGTNKDTANTNLGIYFKFNEGVIDENNINDLDKICLDYSGRLSNGVIVNYTAGCKNTSSAINEYFSKIIEEKEPIIFSSNPLVQQVIDEYSILGFQYDQTNPTSFYKSVPSWIVDETENKDYQDLNYLIQIISSYFDSLHLYIEKLPRIKDVEYLKSVDKQKTFTKNLLTSHGFEFSDIFSDASLYEELFSSTEKEDFSDKLYNVKNAIYQNIYNNLTFIYKSKGTEKSLRNLIRCFGVDDELVKINLYADNITYDLKDRYVPTAIKKKYINFNNTDKITGFIYQKQTPGNPTSKGFITGSTDEKLKFIPLTFETEVIFPKRNDVYSIDYFSAQYTDVSLFGVHTAKDDENDLSWGSDKFNFYVYATKIANDSPDVYFSLSGSFNGQQIYVTSSVYKNTYNNEKWNLSVRLYPDKLNNINLTSGSDEITKYYLDFVGYNVLGDDVNNNFIVSANILSGNYEEAIKQNKRLYVGAHYENFDGTTIKAYSDVKISNLRLWFDYLNNDELLSHALEVNTHGRQYPNWNPNYLNSIVNTFTSSYIISSQDTLVLDWTFEDVTSSDNNGQFYVKDFSSGSLDANYNYGLGWLADYLTNEYTAFGDKFFPNDLSTVENQYIYSLKKQQPETLNSNDLIDISPIDDFTRTKQSKPYTYFIAIEKSMAQVINDEILDWFATIKDFNNLIGDPSERYRIEYNGLAHLRKLFFSRVNNEPSYEKFLEFYKWIDSSITVLINQILPASANITDKIRNVVESHILERNKYENKLPTLEFKGKVKSYPVQSHLEYNYVEQAAELSSLSEQLKVSRYYNFKPIWLKNRVERNNTLVDTDLLPQNDIDREVLRQIINNKNLDSPPTVYLPNDITGYEHDTYKIRTLSKTYKLNTDKLIICEDIIKPINIENTKFTGQIQFAEDLENSASSDVLPKSYKKQGNFLNNYEYLQTSGRTENNKSFVSASGILTSTSSVNELGYADKSLIQRAAKKNVFVERFSAPGGAEVNSRGALDRDAEEYSAYNNLNYRNFRVRKQLHAWLAESMSINPVNPSYHKVNRNFGYLPGEPYYEYVGGNSGNGPIPTYTLSSSAYTLNNFMGILYDTGGVDQDYLISEQKYVFIEPPGGITKFTINSFSTADFNDKLKIYYNPNPEIEVELPKPHGAGGSQGWSDISLGLNNNALALAKIDNKIYVAGDFAFNGSEAVNLNSIAVWESKSNLMPLSGGGVDTDGGEEINCLYVSGTDIYVGGNFYTVGVDPLITIQQPLTDWTILTASTVFSVEYPYKIFSVNDTLYVAGYCDTTSKNGISYYNETSGWQILTSSDGYYISGTIHAIVVKDNYIYYAGNIRNVNNTSDILAQSNIGRYDLTTNTYETLGTPHIDITDFSSGSYVNCMTISGSDVYVGLWDAKNYIVWKWDGSSWSGVGDQILNFVPTYANDIQFSGSDIYLGVTFEAGLWTLSSSIWIPVANYDGSYVKQNNINPNYNSSTGLEALKGESGVSTVRKIIVNDDGTIDIFGGFNKLADNNGNAILELSGAAKISFDVTGSIVFSQIGDGLLVYGSPTYDTRYVQQIHAAHYSGSDLYVAGAFDDYTSYKVYKLVGTAWIPQLSSDYSSGEGVIYDFTFLGEKTYFVGNDLLDSINSNYNNVLQTGGTITVPTPTTSVNNIAKYDTLTDAWSSLGDGLPDTVWTITKFNGEIYAGYDGEDALSGNYISKFNGTSWEPVGVGDEISTSVYALASSGSDLYIGGNFFFPKPDGDERIAVWNGTSWRGFFEGVTYPTSSYVWYHNGAISALEVYENKLYIGGDFTNMRTGIGGEEVYNHICVFDTETGIVSALGNGLNDIVKTIFVSDSNNVYAGGSFTVTGNFISKWNGTNWSQLGNDLITSGGNYVTDILVSGNCIFVVGDYTTSSLYSAYEHGVGRYCEVPTYTLLAELSGSEGLDYSSSSIQTINTFPYDITIPEENGKFLISWVTDEEDTNSGFSITWNEDQYIAPVPPTLVLTAVAKSIKHDNEYVVHQIPRNDIQYAWMTASAVPSLLPYGFINGYANQYFSTISFLSGNLSGSHIIDYVGLNNVIFKNVNTSSNTISPDGNVIDVNAYISNIYGPYQGASWKQIRGTENKLVNISRKNNHILVQDVPKIRTIVNNDRTKTTTIDSRSTNFTSYKEPAVDYNYPMEHKVMISSSLDGIQNINIVNSYDNNKNLLSNIDLSLRLSVSERQELQTHDLLNNLSKDNTYDPSPVINEASYIQQVFPSRETVTIKEIRVKDNYDDNLVNSSSVAHVKTYWKENYIDRRRIDGSSDLFSSISSSYTALTNFTSSILGKCPVIHNVSGTHYASIYSIDNLTGSFNEYNSNISGSIARPIIPWARRFIL